MNHPQWAAELRALLLDRFPAARPCAQCGVLMLTPTEADLVCPYCQETPDAPRPA